MMSTAPIRIPIGVRPTTALVIFSLIGYLGSSLTPYVLTALTSGLDVDAVTAGTVLTIMMITMALVGLVTAPIAATKHRRLLARIGLLLATAGFTLAAFSTSLVLTAIMLGLAGVGLGALASSGGAAMASFANPDRVAGIAGIANAVLAAVALALLPIIGLGPLSVFGTFTVFGLLALVVSGWLPQPPVVAATPAAPEPGAVAHRRVYTIAGISLLVLFAVWAMTEDSLWAMITGVAVQRNGLDEATMGLTLSIVAVAGFVGAVVVTVFGGRWPRTIPITVLLLISAGSKFLLAGSTSAEVLIGALIVWSLATNIAFLLLLAAAAGLDATGRWSAPMTSAYAIGIGLAPLAGASLVEALGYEGMLIALGVFGLVLVAPAFVLARLSTRYERGRSRDESVAASDGNLESDTGALPDQSAP